MIRLLILDLDSLLVTVIARAMQHEHIAVESVRSVHAARGRIAAGEVDVALVDANMITATDFALLHGVPVVLTTSLALDEATDPSFGRAQVLMKPFTGGALLTALRDVLGPLGAEPASIVDLLLRAHTQGASAAFRVGAAELYLEAGELVHARMGALEGEPALVAILGDGPHVPEPFFARDVPHSIGRPFRTVLLDALSAIEARERAYLRTEGAALPLRRGGPRP